MSQFSVTELHKDDPNILTGNLSFGSAASVYYAVQEERKSMASEIWIGTVEVSYFHPDAPYKRVNAFTTITTWASSREEFDQKCNLMLESHGWKLLGVDIANPVGEQSGFSDVVEDMLERTRINQNAIIYGTFHDYPVM